MEIDCSVEIVQKRHVLLSFGQIRVEEDKMEMPEDLEQGRRAEELE